MSIKENMEKIYEMTIAGVDLSKDSLAKKIGIKGLNDLVAMGYLKQKGLLRPCYSIADVNGLYQYGLTLQTEGNETEAFKCFEIASASGYVEACKEIFKHYLEKRDVAKALAIFETLEGSVTEEDDRKRCNFYLYLLSFVTTLPKVMADKAKSIEMDDVAINSSSEDKQNLYEKIYEMIFLSDNFAVAKRYIYKVLKLHESTCDDLILLVLLKWAVEELSKTDEAFMDLIVNENYRGLVKGIEAISESRCLRRDEVCMLSILKDVILLRDENIFPSISSQKAENFYDAIEGKDYNLAYGLMKKSHAANNRKLNALETLVKKMYGMMEFKIKYDTSIEADELYKQGSALVARGDFFHAYNCFHECLKKDENHKLANFEVFAEFISVRNYTEAFKYFKKFDDQADGKEKAMDDLYLYLLNNLTDIPREFMGREKNFCYENGELIELCLRKEFTAARKLIEDRCAGRRKTTRESSMLFLINEANLSLGKDKHNIAVMAQDKRFEEIVEFLKAKKKKCGLDKYERFMLQIAEDILYIYENRKLPCVLETTENTFIKALEARDYNAVYRSKDRQIYFSNTLWASIILLLRQVNVAIHEMDASKTSEELFATGEEYWQMGDFFKAYEYYKKCFELDPDYKESIKKMFYYAVMIKRYDLAAQYLEYWKNFNNREEHKEYSMYLFLLNHIGVLSDNLSLKARKISFYDLGGVYRGDDEIEMVMQDVRSSIMNKKFSYAVKIMKEEKAKRIFELQSETVYRLLLEAEKIQRQNKNESLVLVRAGKLQEYIDYIKAIEARCGLTPTMSCSLSLAEKIVSMLSTGEIPPKIKDGAKNIFDAVENSDFKAAKVFNSRHVSSYARYDEVFSILLDRTFDIVSKIESGATRLEVGVNDDGVETTFDAEGEYAKGLEDYRLHKFYEAFSHFKKCLELDPSHKGAATLMFGQYVALKGYKKAIEYFRVMSVDEDIDEQKDDQAYIYLLNYITELPNDLRERATSGFVYEVSESESKSDKDVFYDRIYAAISFGNFKHALGLIRDMAVVYGYGAKEELFWNLLQKAQGYFDICELKMFRALENGNYEEVLNIISEIEKKGPLGARESAMRTIVQDIIKIKTTGELPLKKNYSSVTIFTAIENREYRKALQFNQKFMFANNKKADVLSYLLNDIVSLITNINKKQLPKDGLLTSEQEISIDDMCSSGLVPDMVDAIKGGMELERAFELFKASLDERFLVHLILANYHYGEGNMEVADEHIAAVRGLEDNGSLMGVFYRYVVYNGKRCKTLEIKPIQSEE